MQREFALGYHVVNTVLFLVVAVASAESIDRRQMEERIRWAHAHRAELLTRASAAGTMIIEKTPSDAMIERLKSSMGPLDFDRMQFKGRSVVRFEWYRDGERTRYDRRLPRDENPADLTFYPPAHILAAGDMEKVIFYDVVQKAAGIGAPSRRLTHPAGLYDWLRIEDLYSFYRSPVGDILAGFSEQESRILDVKSIEEDGIPCIEISWTWSQEFSNKVRETTYSRYCIAPQFAYSEISRSFISEWYSPKSKETHILLRAEAHATYQESERFPNVWLIDNATIHFFDLEHCIEETVTVDMDEHEVGIPHDDDLFDFDALGVPVGATVVDRRFAGPSRMYEYSGRRNIGLDSALLFDLAQLPADIRAAKQESRRENPLAFDSSLTHEINDEREISPPVTINTFALAFAAVGLFAIGGLSIIAKRRSRERKGFS